MTSPTCVSRNRLGKRLALIAMALLLTLSDPGIGQAGGRSRLVELADSESVYTGKVIAKDAERCCLMDTFGTIHHLPIGDLKSLKVVGESFQAASSGEFRRRIQQEFRSGYEVEASSHYIVAGRKGRARAYINLFEEIYRQVNAFFSIRGFSTSDPEVPLVAIVFATQDEFKEYCGKDGVLWSRDLRGYYSLRTNRVALFDDPALLDAVRGKEVSAVVPRSPNAAVGYAASLSALMNSVAGETASVIVHETTHQVGFNIGIHSRTAGTPTWLIEGLATALEAPGMRAKGKAGKQSRINASRLDWFRGDYETRWKPGDLASLVASDEMFKNQPFDAYSSAWAFTYFMTESPARARTFVKYLKMVSDRDPLAPYPAEERLRDFQAAFGDISRLEVEYLRASRDWSESDTAIGAAARR